MFMVCRPKLERERGSALLFFLAGALPLILLFLGLALDLSRYYLLREEAQRVADNAVILAAKYLPFTEPAISAARAYVASEAVGPGLDKALQIEKIEADTADSISVRISRSASFLLLSFFGASQIKFTVQARAGINAKNVLIFMDNSSHMSPAWESERPWGGGAWPTAKFFNKNPHLVPSYEEPAHPRRRFRVATQQCFNPLFSAVKEATIRLYDYLSAFDGHSVGLLMGPGQNDDDILVVRDVMPFDLNRYANSRVTYNAGQATFGYYRSQFVRDEYCLAAAEQEPLIERSLTPEDEDLIDKKVRHGGYRIPADRGANRPRSYSLIPSGSFTLPLAQLSKVTPKDVIWSRAARRPYRENGGIESHVNIRSVLRQVRSTLLGAPFRAERAGQGFEPSHLAFLMLGDFPWQNGVRFSKSRFDKNYPGNLVVRTAIATELEALNQAAKQLGARVAIYFVVPRNPHEYTPPSDVLERWYNTVLKRQGKKILIKEWLRTQDHDCVDDPQYEGNIDSHARPTQCVRFFKKDGPRFEAFLKKQNFTNVRVTLIRPPDLASIPQDTMAFLPMVNRSVVLTH
ncbi:MAG: hypothetical protein GX589_05470 [Deltaproteobacteria bacterium]|nr:hypothetical protein [Deltaproteobacteria bacterium]